MKRRKQKTSRREDQGRKARRQARIRMGPVPPAQVIEPSVRRKAKHKKKAAEDDAG